MKGNYWLKRIPYFLLRLKGPEIDQGELSRWLSSAVLFPEALLPNDNLTWEPLNDYSARLLFSYKDIKIDAVIYFGRSGEIVRFVTDRYASETDKFEKWSAYYKSYADHNGRKIPTEVASSGISPRKLSLCAVSLCQYRFNAGTKINL